MKMKINYTFKITETERKTLKAFDKWLETARNSLNYLTSKMKRIKKKGSF